MWIKLESLFGKQYDLRGHQLENELISLKPSEFKTIKELITKFRTLVLFLNQCRITKEKYQLILSILSNLVSEYSVFVSIFYATNLAVWNWRMPSLDAFIGSLTQEKSHANSNGDSQNIKGSCGFYSWKKEYQVQRKSKHEGEKYKVRLQRLRF